MKTIRKEFLPFSPPSIGDEEIEAVVETLKSKWITTGPRTKQFEAAFRDHVGGQGAIALSSCTAALHLSLLVHDIGPGDEVITTPMTFAASANVIEHVGATPVFADVEADTLNISPAAVEAAITDRTRAILAVHYAGHPAELDTLQEIATRAGIVLIEDAAHSFPAAYKGRAIGSGANLAAFSFYATKNLTTAEGGMLTGDPALLKRAAVLGLHGMVGDAWRRYEAGSPWFYEVVAPGYKYNMTDIQSSIGLVQLRGMDEKHARRYEVASRYNEAFGSVGCFELPAVRAEVETSWHLYPLRLVPGMLGIDRDEFVRQMAKRNIGTSVHFIPVHMHPFYANKYGYKPEDFPVAASNFQRIFSLPLHPHLTDEEVQDVIDAVLDVASSNPA